MQPNGSSMKKIAPIFFCALIFLVSNYAQAQTQNSVRGEIIAGDKNQHALVLTLEQGWYTYWRMAGDNGLPPKFDWSKSANISGVEIEWPIPSRFSFMDMHSFGYKDQVVFPLIITPTDANAPVTLSLAADLVVCKDICIPAKLELSQQVASARPDPAAYQAAKKSIPFPENTDDLGLNTAVLGKEALVLTVYAKDGFAGGADVIVETPAPILTAPPEIIPDETDKTKAVLKIKAPAGMDLSKNLFGKKANILFIHGGKAIEKEFSF